LLRGRSKKLPEERSGKKEDEFPGDPTKTKGEWGEGFTATTKRATSSRSKKKPSNKRDRTRGAQVTIEYRCKVFISSEMGKIGKTESMEKSSISIKKEKGGVRRSNSFKEEAEEKKKKLRPLGKSQGDDY